MQTSAQAFDFVQKIMFNVSLNANLLWKWTDSCGNSNRKCSEMIKAQSSDLWLKAEIKDLDAEWGKVFDQASALIHQAAQSSVQSVLLSFLPVLWLVIWRCSAPFPFEENEGDAPGNSRPLILNKETSWAEKCTERVRSAAGITLGSKQTRAVIKVPSKFEPSSLDSIKVSRKSL